MKKAALIIGGLGGLALIAAAVSKPTEDKVELSDTALRYMAIERAMRAIEDHKTYKTTLDMLNDFFDFLYAHKGIEPPKSFFALYQLSKGTSAVDVMPADMAFFAPYATNESYPVDYGAFVLSPEEGRLIALVEGRPTLTSGGTEALEKSIGKQFVNFGRPISLLPRNHGNQESTQASAQACPQDDE